jgi:hypothetical protein
MEEMEDDVIQIHKVVSWRYIIFEDEGSIVVGEISCIEKKDDFISYLDAMGDEYVDDGFFLANTLSEAKEMASIAANALKNDVVQVRYCSAVGSEALLFKAVKS